MLLHTPTPGSPTTRILYTISSIGCVRLFPLIDTLRSNGIERLLLLLSDTAAEWRGREESAEGDEGEKNVVNKVED